MPQISDHASHDFELKLFMFILKLMLSNVPNKRACMFIWHIRVVTGGQIYGGDFPKFCGLLREYEL